MVDYKTQEPIETVSIYFDNSTIGTITNSSGKFSLSYNDAIQSPLIISFMGYQKEIILDYRSRKNIIIQLKESINNLNEIVVNADDGLTRKQKLKIFRKQFLGFSNAAKSCKILNEDDLILRYDKKISRLTANGKSPIIFKNRKLQYTVTYDINEFEIDFNYVEEKNNIFTVRSVLMQGTTFYENLENFNEKAAKKNRDKAYNGSILEFMRALYNRDLASKGYRIFQCGFQVSPWEFIKIEPVENSNLKQLCLEKSITILYEKDKQSEMQLLIPEILIDYYGNFSNPSQVFFSGFMGNQRMGDLLPMDYKL